jgi:hypothetical protein
MADTVGNETFFPALPWLARQGLLFFPAVFFNAVSQVFE